MSEIRIEHVSKSFGEATVLKDIDLTVERGNFVTLLGPSGCGKTTLLRIVAGLERPDQGRVTCADQVFVDTEAGRFAEPQDRRLGFVFQDYGLWPHLSVAENVAFPLKMAKARPAEIDHRVGEVLGNVRLEEHAGKLPEQLSGGQKQRVSIARALAGKPRLILFDEPLSNLDANLREELGQEIRLLSKQLGLTCINVTHDRREAQILSDGIALMKDGVIHQLGRPENLFRAPCDIWSAQFLDAGNILPADGILTNGHAPGSQVLVPRNAVHVSESRTGVSARVTDCIFIEDRYEITAELHGARIKVYAPHTVDVNDVIQLELDKSSIVDL